MTEKPATQVSSMRATAHPVRLQMLSLLTGAEMSAAEIARELDLTHANASYHLRVLAAAGVVVQAGEEKVRGGVAKLYRHPWDQSGTTTKASPEDPDLYIRAVSQELVRRFTARKRGGKSIISDAEMWVEPEVWDEVGALVRQASALIHSQAKPPRTRGTIHVNMTAAVFEMGDPSQRTRPSSRTGEQGAGGR